MPEELEEKPRCIFTEISGNLIDQKDCYYAHFISADFALGSGVSLELDKKYQLRKWLHNCYGVKWYSDVYREFMPKGVCLLNRNNNIFNLVVKERYFKKPTAESIEESLKEMRLLCQREDVKRIAISKWDCTFGKKLQWQNVKQIFERVLHDLNVEIYVCYGGKQ